MPQSLSAFTNASESLTPRTRADAPAAARRSGYAKFLELAALNDASRGFITDDTLTIVAELSVGVVPTGVARAPIAHEGYADTLFVEPPAAANQCGICLCVMKDPVGGCRHGHKCVLMPRSRQLRTSRCSLTRPHTSFCRGCLTTWLSNGCKNCPTCRSSVHNVVPNRYAADAIGALAVRCPATVDQLWHLVRCAWTGPLHELAAHRSSCVAEEVPCFWALCKKRMLRGIADSHAARCEHRSVFCPKCSHVLNGADAISTHGARCLAEPARCSNAGCDALVLRAAMPAHRAVCTFEVVPCAVPGCRASVTRNGINAHMASAAAAHMQALCGQVVALTARLEDAERELRRISAEQGASKRPRH